MSHLKRKLEFISIVSVEKNSNFAFVEHLSQYPVMDAKVSHLTIHMVVKTEGMYMRHVKKLCPMQSLL